jgi:hypothetical protein
MTVPFCFTLIKNKEMNRRVEVLVGPVDSVDKSFLRTVIHNTHGKKVQRTVSNMVKNTIKTID